MPSQIKVDEIKNVAGQYKIKTDTFEGQTTANNMTINAGNITVQGEGTATTNLQQGLLKGWINTNQASINDSFNFGSVTDNGTGNYTSTLTNALSNTTYCVSISSNMGGGNGGFNGTATLTTSTILTYSFTNTGSYRDVNPLFLKIAGDLA